ncbi:MAG TPA: peptide MFS transporter [Steroidobacteraceae bacterium]|nr:peptide MFS transporter [Steroidobacteraceae bacterium]
MSATFFGHPRGLATLFFTEMWERFTYYGMRALLVLFLVGAVSSGGFGIDDKTATAIYGLYTSAVFLVALPGGWIADRLIGARRAVLIGGLIIMTGNAILAISTSPAAFYVGLVVIVLGVGLLKPNVSAIVADLYPEGGARLDAGFTVFYIGINIGSALGPLVTGEAQQLFGPRAGFATAAIFMGFGVLQFHLTRRHLGESGRHVAATLEPLERRRLWLRVGVAGALAGAVLLGCALGFIAVDPVSLAHYTFGAIVSIAVLYFGYFLIAAGLNAEERRRGIVLVVLFLGSALFWSGYEQAGSSLNLFAERYTDRVMTSIHFVIPTEWFQSLNPVFIVLFAPAFAWAWVALARRQLDPSVPAKFAIGVILMGSGFLLMAAAAAIVASGTKVLPFWLIFTYLLHTFGELCLSPVGLSFYTKLSPKRFVGQMMGMFFLSISLGNLAAGIIAGEFDAEHVAAMPSQYMHIVYFAVGLGAMLLILSRPVKKLMGDVR